MLRPQQVAHLNTLPPSAHPLHPCIVYLHNWNGYGSHLVGVGRPFLAELILRDALPRKRGWVAWCAGMEMFPW